MIGRDIHDFLEEKGITAVKLADLLDITAVQLSRIVNGRSMPSRITMEKIAKALDVNISFSSDDGQWFLVPKFSSMKTNLICRRISKMNPVPRNSGEVVTIPLLDIADISCSTISDISEMEKSIAKTSNFMPVLLKDIGDIKSNSPYAVIMNGGSMYDAGIPYGAYVAINPNEPVYNGDPVLATLGIQEDISIRWLFKYSNSIKLCSSNPIKYPPIILNREDDKKEGQNSDNHNFFHIYGKIMAVYTKPSRGI